MNEAPHVQNRGILVIVSIPVFRFVVLCPLALFAVRAGEKGPVGMYCGGNQIVQMEEIVRASKLSGVVLDPSGAAIPHATVQVQEHGSTHMAVDAKADDNGQFVLPKLKAGRYWLGVSSQGFNLHVWDIEIKPRAGLKRLPVHLSLGT